MPRGLTRPASAIRFAGMLSTLCVLVSPAACAPAAPTDLDALASARERWAAMGSPNYQFSAQRSCYCPQTAPVRITVVNGAITAIQDLDTGALLEVSQFEHFRTMEGAFDWIDASLGRRPSAFSARYDPVIGHPIDVDIDFEQGTVDDEIRLVIWGFSQS